MTNKVVDLNQYRLGRLAEQTANLGTEKIKNASKESGYKVLALIDNKCFSFLKTIESTKEYDDLIDYLKNQGVKDLRVYLKDGSEILDSEQAIGQDTFRFSDEASALLFEVLGDLFSYGVTDKGTPMIIAS